ncbi:methyltransferase domain-containing protein [Streptomyces sp. NBC_01518]|uniref:methyltransferase domain-containing protein n=1 Tax=Streptomyces sp. NBC_01518 TaxID=2903891 RepID=UPI0038630FFF
MQAAEFTVRWCGSQARHAGWEGGKAHQHQTAPWKISLEADAQDLPFGDESFDAMVCQFGVCSTRIKRSRTVRLSECSLLEGVTSFRSGMPSV